MITGRMTARMGFRFAQAVAGAAAICLANAAAAQGDAFPTKTVQFVVAYSPGTGADILARLLGPRLAERWKTSVVTENRVGATGTIASAVVAKAAPDGHTLLFIATSFGTTPALRRILPFDPVESFAPVALFATSGLGVVVHPQLPVKTLRDFINLAKRRPGELHYSSPGVGGPQHLSMELLKLETGINIVHVPYKGFAGAVADAMAGHVQAMVSALQSAHSHVSNGRLRMLAVMSGERSDAFPGVPTMKELGFPSLEIYTWYGAFAPAGTPASTVSRINSDINALLNLPEIRATMETMGMNPAGGPPDRLGNLVKSEVVRWKRVVAAAKIKAD
ncbi:MAG: tripartite tricarboxylate transporter substrate binding protein [Betaproteobacteria bacterium]|nr:tripartite tricarboxylate transporter substrate binding protein [Betaproteobacteria bacterium]